MWSADYACLGMLRVGGDVRAAKIWRVCVEFGVENSPVCPLVKLLDVASYLVREMHMITVETRPSRQ